MTADADPIVAAVAEALSKAAVESLDIDLDAVDAAADVAVEAHRRAALDQRDDGEQLERLVELLNAAKGTVGEVQVFGVDVSDLLAALADAEIGRRQAEADRDMLVQIRDRAVGKMADYCDMIRAVRERGDALLDGELAHRSRDYGRGVAQATRDMLAALDGPKDG